MRVERVRVEREKDRERGLHNLRLGDEMGGLDGGMYARHDAPRRVEGYIQ